MDLMHLPFLWYLVDFKNVAGTYMMGFIGLTVTCVAAAVCWHQIRSES